ncbi:ATP-binding cassette domain-containing protein [Sunxiuqinia sp. A32]|uniref:ATP-binding cassette domain-containing protein n=1 Tax=Sunxiuqinia sp. A32 TaxID=3461496 RepID=UPI004045B6EE
MSVIIENISKSYGAQKALDSISFKLAKGELVGFLGPNGAGKSTLMKIITGYLAADSGSVMIEGNVVRPEDHQLRTHIGYLPEHNPLYTDLYIKEYLEMVAGFYKLDQRIKRITEAIEMTGLGLEQKKKIGALSKGYRQRVGLAQALIHDPSVLILDEPTTGLDPNQLEEIRALILRVSQEKTVLFSTHIMQEVEAICSRVLVINRGKLIADGSVDEFKSRKLTKNQQVFVEFNQAVKEDLLNSSLPIGIVEKNGLHSFLLTSSGEQDLRPLLFDFAVKNNVKILGMNEQQSSLEGIFQQLTQTVLK